MIDVIYLLADYLCIYVLFTIYYPFNGTFLLLHTHSLTVLVRLNSNLIYKLKFVLILTFCRDLIAITVTLVETEDTATSTKGRPARALESHSSVLLIYTRRTLKLLFCCSRVQ